MPLQTYCVYLTALAAGMLTPGPAMLQALTLGLRHGPGPVAVVALGNVCVSVAQVAAALYGLSLLAGQQPRLLRLLGLAGAAYLVFLGWAMWRAGGRFVPDAGRDGAVAAFSPAGLFCQGALVALVNPKAWAFLAAMLPPFAAGGLPHPATVALLAGPIAVLAFGGMMAYAACGSWLTRFPRFAAGHAPDFPGRGRDTVAVRRRAGRMLTMPPPGWFSQRIWDMG